MASPVASGDKPDIVTGLRDVRRSLGNRLRYTKEPMFRNVVGNSSGGEGMVTSVETSTKLSPRQQMATTIANKTATGTKEAVLGILSTASIENLKDLLHVEVADDSKSFVDLGIDSLAVTAIESWVKKELKVNFQQSVFFRGSVKNMVETVVSLLDKESISPA